MPLSIEKSIELAKAKLLKLIESVKKPATRAAILTTLAYGVSQGLRFVGNLILTRLLVPELFGLMALVNTFILGIQLFSDIGINPSIIRSKRWNDPVFLNTAWTLQALRSCWIWLGCILIAWPISNLYGDSRLIWLIPCVGLAALMEGFTSTSVPILNRNLEIGKLLKLELGTQFISLTVMIVWAFFNRSIWALVAGSLISNSIKVFWSHRLQSPATHRFTWDKDSRLEIISFGKWILISTMMSFLASQADRLILGKLVSLELLGVYAIAFTMADLPRQIIQKVNQKVMLPVLVKYIDLERQTLREKILQKRRFVLVGLISIVVFLVCFGDVLITVLYDSRYEAATWMLPILAIGLWPLLLVISIDKVLYALGNPKYTTLGSFTKVIYMVTLLPLGYHYLGFLGAVIAIAFNDITVYAVVSYGLWREKLSCIQQDIVATLILIGLIALILTVRYLLGFNLPIHQLL
ncbi:MAG: oligosaccharide flippase family protein [Microcoleaceae cyanobacterium]